ncbi:MAG: AAA family ATPase [Candidatus Omnitrophica bacterium]|nr:AAA family ATPase [Candidatus Omnitrophota bacterium]
MRKSKENSLLQAPPNDADAEIAVLGSFFNTTDGYDILKEISPFLLQSDFYSEIRGKLYKVICSHYESGKCPDIVLLQSEIKNNYNNDADRMIDELTNCIQSCDFITLINAKYYAEIVKEKSKRRKTIRELHRLFNDSGNNSIDFESLVDDAEQTISDIKSNRSLKEPSRTIENAVSFIQREKSKTPYIIDTILPEQGFTSICGFTGMGKSSLTMQIMLSILKKQTFLNDFNVAQKDYNILYINLENSEFTIDRLLKTQLKEIELTNDQLSRLYIPSCIAMSLDSKMDIRILSNWIQDYNIDIVVIDPILDAFSGDQNDLTVVRNLIRKFREINGKISWILLHHFNKGDDEQDLIKRMLGSVGFANAMTCILGLRRFSKSVNPLYKKIEFGKTRDAELPDSIKIRMNPATRIFEVVADHEEMIPLSNQAVADILKNGPMQYCNLVTTVEFLLGISESSAKKLIASALMSHKINTDNGLYRIASNTLIPNYLESTS